MRQIVTVTIFGNAPNVSLPIILRFQPSVVYVRQITYSTEQDPDSESYQIYCSITKDLIIGATDQTSVYHPDSALEIAPGFYQGNVNFQILDPPADGVGIGVLADTAEGVFQVVLEFAKE